MKYPATPKVKPAGEEGLHSPLITTNSSTAPTAQGINRNDNHEDDSIIIIETLTSKHFDAARKVENEFYGAGKGICFGCCPLAWCPTEKGEFEAVYRSDPDRLSTYALAIRQSDQLLVGICKTRAGGQKNTWDESMMHVPEGDELYIDVIAVTAEARGKGVGSRLMQWAEEKAKERNAKKITLGVVNGNPAKRLYDRSGFVETGSSCCAVGCLVGRPNGHFGGVTMEKQV